MTYRLEYLGTHSGTPVDITNFCEPISKFTDVGTGEIVSAKIMLDARFGDFVTEHNNNTTPIISQYDLFHLRMTDDADNTYDRFLIQDDIEPTKNETGTHLSLELFGRERYLQKMYYPGHFYFGRFRDLIRKIAIFYNTNKGTEQPFLHISTTDLNRIPGYAWGVFDFGDETTVYDALMEIVNRLALAIPAGGGGQQYGVRFVDLSTSRFIMRILPRDFLESSSVIEKPLNITRVKSPQTGNIQVVSGQEGTGSYPREIAEMRGLIEEYEHLPDYDNTVDYAVGAYTRYNGNVYQMTTDADAGTVPTDTTKWTQRSFAEYVNAYTGNTTFQYSPWTQHKSALWKNWGGNPEGTGGGFNSLCFPDSNLVIRESGATAGNDLAVWRDWVDFRTIGEAVPPRYGSTPYTGMRILVDTSLGTPVAPFTGNDSQGKPYADSLIQYTETGKWIVFREAEQFDQCMVRREGKVFEYNEPHTTSSTNRAIRKANRVASSSNLAWRDNSRVLLGNDCLHYPLSVTNTAGLIGSDANDSTILPSTYLADSAIKIVYRHVENQLTKAIAILFAPLASFVTDIYKRVTNLFNGELKSLTDAQENQLYQTDTYNNGWWCTLFESPFPFSTDNGISESVGALYSQPVIDLKNLNYTPSGLTGYGHSDSNELGSLDGIGFFFNFDISGLTLTALDGSVPFRVVIYDINGGVWKSDIVIRFQKETQFIRIPFSSFTNYRARLPIGYSIANWIQRTKNAELFQSEIKDTRFLKRIVMHCLLPYDDQGRYDPFKLDSLIHNIIPTITNTNITYTGIIDAFHFTKTPIAIAQDSTDLAKKHLMGQIKKYPNVSNVIQLGKIAKAELDVTKHQNDLIEVQMEDRCDFVAETSVYVKDDDFISDSEMVVDGTAVPHTRKYIIDKVTYSVGDRSSDSGLIATIRMFRRIAT